MKKYRIRLFAVLVLAAVMLSFTACGASSAADGNDSAAPVENAAPAAGTGSETEQVQPVEEQRIYLVYDEHELLVKETIDANSHLPSSPDSPVWGTVMDCVKEYSYDEFGNATVRTAFYSQNETDSFYNAEGKEYDDYTYEYDSEGELIKLSRPGGSMNGVQFIDTLEIKNGRVVKSVKTVKGYDEELDVIEFFRNADGNVYREEETQNASTFLYVYLFNSPEKNTYEYDNEGHITRWEHISPDDPYDLYNGADYEITYEYDNAGNLIRKTVTTDAEVETTEITRDADGRTLSAAVTQADGKVTAHSFSYDEEGRIISDEITDEKNTVLLEIAYNDDGYAASMTKYVNGKKKNTEKYTYTQETESRLVGKSKNSFDEANIFGSSSYNFYTFKNKTSQGNPYYINSYELTVAGTQIRYVKTSTDYAYDMILVGREVGPDEFEPIESADAFYPELKESYGGHPIPKPDGSEVLKGVRMSSNSTSELDVVSTPVYDQNGELAGCISGFDANVPRYNGLVLEFDEQDRVIRKSYENSDTVIEFRYADDMSSYTAIYDSPDHKSHYETEVSLEDMRLTDLIRVKLEDRVSTGDFEYTDDGLLSSYSCYNTEGKFSYSFETDSNGALSRVICNNEVYSYGSDYLVFDEHGYLVKYMRIGGVFPNLTFTYIYGSAD